MNIVVKGAEDTAKTMINEMLKNCKESKRILFPVIFPYRSAKKIKNIKIIICLRDPRIGWLVTEHKPNSRHGEFIEKRFNKPSTIERYIEVYNKFLNFLDTDQTLIVRAEDMFKDMNGSMKRIFDFVGIEWKDEYMFKNWTYFNDYISMYDFKKILRYRKLIKFDEIDKISKGCKEYLTQYGYPETINLEEYFAPASELLLKYANFR